MKLFHFDFDDDFIDGFVGQRSRQAVWVDQVLVFDLGGVLVHDEPVAVGYLALLAVLGKGVIVLTFELVRPLIVLGLGLGGDVRRRFVLVHEGL